MVGFPDKNGKYFFIDTENIISPALFLKEKVAATTQAQFDLAQLAWKKNPEGFGTTTCPVPFVGNMPSGEYDENYGTYLSNLKNMCIDKTLGHGWYLVDVTKPGDPEKLECHFPQFNDITCEVFSYIANAPTAEGTLPDELPAPWEDPGIYMRLASSSPDYYTYNDYLTGDRTEPDITHYYPLGVTEPTYPTEAEIAPSISSYIPGTTDCPTGFSKEGGQCVKCPEGLAYNAGKCIGSVFDQYVNTWYRGVTQLYEKPMSEILRTWFKEE